MRRLNEAVEAMKSGSLKGMSILEVFEQETGIELALDGDKSYHEYAWLSADTQVKPINSTQYIYMMNRWKKWIPTVLLAGVLLVLHRQERWGADRLTDFTTKINELRNKFGEDEKSYEDYMLDRTGHLPKEMWGR